MKKTSKKAIEVGAGVAAGAAAIAVGYYFYASKNAKDHRQIAAKWAHKLKKEAVIKLSELNKLDKQSIAKVIDKVAVAYKTASNVKKEDLSQAVSELKANWAELKNELKKEVGQTKRTVSKASKGAAKNAKSTVKKIGAKATTRTKSP